MSFQYVENDKNCYYIYDSPVLDLNEVNNFLSKFKPCIKRMTVVDLRGVQSIDANFLQILLDGMSRMSADPLGFQKGYC